MISRILRMPRHAIREYNKNGPKGVLKRAYFLFFSPRHSLVQKHIKKWKNLATKKKQSNYLETDKVIKNCLSIAILVSPETNIADFKKNLGKLMRFIKGKKEVVVVVGTIKKRDKEIITSSCSRKCKVFDMGAMGLDDNRLEKKALKESNGEYILLTSLTKEVDEKELAIANEMMKKGLDGDMKKKELKIIKNSQQLRKNLPLKIAYIVPSVGISGGLAVVLRHVNMLKEEGHDVLLISFNPHPKTNSWFQNSVPVVQLTSKNMKLLENIDILVATHWSTAFFMDLHPSRRKVYFVQSDERRFDPDDKEAVGLVHLSYAIDSEYMTEAIWIQKWLNNEFGHQSYYVPNGLDPDVFHQTTPLEPKGEKPRVLIEGAIDVWFKGMDDAYAAVKDLDCELWVISCQGKPRPGWKYDRFFECVPLGEMKKIYSSCDVFLKMSKVEGFFGPPMEAMACGCAVVVGKVTGYDEYIENRHNALVVDQGDIENAKKAVGKLIENEELRKKLVANGLETAKSWTWDKTKELLLAAIRKEEIKKYYSSDFPEKYDFAKIRERINIKTS